jgi:hypothetical protein
MKKISLYLIAILLGGLILSCSRETCDCKEDQPVLFQYEYINYAWGYRHHGFMIGADGTIHGFRQPAAWKEYDSAGMISRDDLEFNLGQCDTLFGNVDQDSLCDYFDQVKDIRTGEIKDLGIYMADAGTGVLSAWYPTLSDSIYERVFLISNGDSNLKNTHEKAGDLINWLKKTGLKTDRFYWFDGE